MQMSKNANNDVNMNSPIAGVVKLTSEKRKHSLQLCHGPEIQKHSRKNVTRMSKQFSPFGFDSTEDRKSQ